MTERPRKTGFASLAEVMPEVEKLMLGHRMIGNWSLAQVCKHLSGSMVASVDGVPFRYPWILRKTVGPWLVRRILSTGRFPRGVKLPDRLAPGPGLDARAEAEALRAAIAAFSAHPGPFADHPLGGPIGRDGWARFHAIHSAHHLGFAMPEPPPGPGGRPLLQ